LKLKRYAQLTSALAGMSCRNIVEIGVWNGKRAQELAGAALRRNPEVTYHGFDLFESLTDEELEEELSKRPPAKHEVEADLRRFQRLQGLLPWRHGRFEFELHQGYTRDTLPAFHAANPEFRADFVFIDGGHKIETIGEDWENCSRLVDRGGAIYLDDYYGNAELAKRFGCNTLIDGLRDDPTWDVTVLPETDTFERIGSVQIARAAPA
jgi:hypothetical protein